MLFVYKRPTTLEHPDPEKRLAAGTKQSQGALELLALQVNNRVYLMCTFHI